ncbi:hypothetical protein RRG08_013073 [Elysia crispata]|uniref:Uncharacterized protein n=1 Tax=Elysia crispata TaxID=231223 RepID=A0AAE1A055_9GAST|nr:hypothetical protein RRG08_013073 [Elysia crispata]
MGGRIVGISLQSMEFWESAGVQLVASSCPNTCWRELSPELFTQDCPARQKGSLAMRRINNGQEKRQNGSARSSNDGDVM